MSPKHHQLIGYLVYTTQRALAHSLEVTLKPYNVTPGQWNLLNQLDRAGELSQKALADEANKEQATITRYLDTLERKGLVLRSPDKNDRRAHIISLTDKARDLIKNATPTVNETADYVVKEISQKDLDTFLSVLDKLQQNAEDFTSDL